MVHFRYTIGGVEYSPEAFLQEMRAHEDLRRQSSTSPPPTAAEEIVNRMVLTDQLEALLKVLKNGPRLGRFNLAATLNCPPEPTAKPKKQYRALDKPADRESVVLVRLVAAVSAAFYKFDLQKDTRPVITEIINALALYGPVSDRETVKGWLEYAARVGGQADGLLRTRVKGTFCKLLSGMLRHLYGWLAEESHVGTAEERAARAKERAVELHADLATAGTVVSVEEILEALTFVDA